MEKVIVNGGKPLSGDLPVSGMKNAALGILFATILAEDKCVIENVPAISDITITLDILRAMHVGVRYLSKNTVEIDSTFMRTYVAPEEGVRRMRASYYCLGATLGRFGRAVVGCPGGCDFGVRPIDQHIKGFEALGARVSVECGNIEAIAEDGLKGASIYMDKVSVGATINVMLAAVKAEGLTVIENAAHEPHIVDTANFLNACGADISGAGTDVIKIRGVKRLHGVTYTIIPDMIEAGTYMCLAGAIPGSCLRVTNVIPKHLDSLSAKLIEMGLTVEEEDEAVVVKREGDLQNIHVHTLPYPGFPTDMNPQMCVLLALARGTSTLTEGVWDSRFRYVEELKRMGAHIKVDGRVAIVEGVSVLTPAPVRAVDLRAGAAMIIAALAADGRSEIHEAYHIYRGYEGIVEKLRAVGADISAVTVPDHALYGTGV